MTRQKHKDCRSDGCVALPAASPGRLRRPADGCVAQLILWHRLCRLAIASYNPTLCLPFWARRCWGRPGRRAAFCLPLLSPAWSPSGTSGWWGCAGMVCLCQSEWCSTRISRLAGWWKDPGMLPAWSSKCLLQNAQGCQRPLDPMLQIWRKLKGCAPAAACKRLRHLKSLFHRRDTLWS